MNHQIDRIAKLAGFGQAVIDAAKGSGLLRSRRRRRRPTKAVTRTRHRRTNNQEE
jgi:hypothetical protein